MAVIELLAKIRLIGGFFPDAAVVGNENFHIRAITRQRNESQVFRELLSFCQLDQPVHSFRACFGNFLDGFFRGTKVLV